MNLLKCLLMSAVVYQDVPVKKNAEVVHPGHPAIIDTGILADKSKKYKTGTILKADADGKLSAAAPADTPAAVLTEDSDGVNAEVLVLRHGMVVQGRLLDSSGSESKETTAAMADKLRAWGIYPTQLFTSAKKG